MFDDIFEEFDNVEEAGGARAHEEKLIRRWERLLADERSTDELIDRALVTDDAEEYVRVLETLQVRASREVLEAAAALCASRNHLERQLGVNIIGRLGNHTWILRAARCLLDSEVEQAQQHGERLMKRIKAAFGDVQQYPKEALAILLPMLDKEDDVETLRDILCAIGEYQQFHPSVSERIAAFRTHPERDVRFTVTTRLSIGIDNDAAMLGLADLCDDEDEDVRSMAMTGVARFSIHHENDNTREAIRQALLRRLRDIDPGVRGDALAGLADRSDSRVVEALLEESERPERADGFADALVTAGRNLGDPRLYPLLVEAQVHGWLSDDGKENKKLAEALEKCRVK